jgi:RNA polymerase sigma-70 factor (ECF subfamily)
VRVDTEQTVGTSVTAGAVDWDAVYARHAAALLGYLRRLTRDQETAEDLMHTTFQRAMVAKRVPDAMRLGPWLYRIATNLVIDRARRARRFQFLPFTGREVSPSESGADGVAVRIALRAIPAELAATLVLRLHEGFSRSEIAGMTGVSERTVKWRLEQGRIAFSAAYARAMEGEHG